MTQANPTDIARAMYRAYVEKDRAAAEALIAEDFHFTSPLDNRLDRAAYFKRCWANAETISGFDLIHVVAQAGYVYVTYEGMTTAGKRFRNTELITVRAGRIVEVEVYFGWSLPHAAAPGGFIDKQ